MNDSPSSLEERLAAYRQPLDDALSQNPAPTSTSMSLERSNSAITLDADDFTSTEPPTGTRWPVLAVTAACVALIVAAGLLIVSRTNPSTGVSTNSFDDTAPVSCVREDGVVDVGDPAPGLVFDDPQFISSLPADTPPRELAIRAILNPVAGDQCIAFDPGSIATSLDQSSGVVTAALDAPVAGIPFEVRLTIVQTAEAIGVTRIDGLTSFAVDQSEPTATLNLADELPPTADSIDVRFRAGADVFDITTTIDQASAIALVPSDDTVASEDLSSVTYVIRDEAGSVLDTGGTTIPA